MFSSLHLKYPDNKAFISAAGEEFTYLELNQFASKIADLLPSRSLVFLLCENTAGALLGYFSFISNGIVPLLLDAKIGSKLLQNLISIYQPDYIWSPEGLRDFGGEILFEEAGFTMYAFKKKQSVLHPDLALLLTTSGSTGSPKLVRISYTNLFSNANSIAEYLKINRNERPITTLPMYYSYGLSVINSHLLKGATILLTDRSVMEKEFWSFFKEERASSIAGVPYTYQMLKRLRLNRMDLPGLKTLTQAGGKLPAELVREFGEYARDTNRRFYVMYGQTEATARMSYLPSEKLMSKSTSIGIAIPGGSFSIIDPNENQVISPKQAGELMYSGPNVSMGYAETLNDLSLGDVNNGVLHTGDIAYFDCDGFYYITGRLKRFVKMYGNRISLDQVEEIIKEITLDCACLGTDENLNVFLTDADKKNSVIALISQRTGIRSKDISVQIIDHIPRNSSGKIQYSQIQ